MQKHNANNGLRTIARKEFAEKYVANRAQGAAIMARMAGAPVRYPSRSVTK